METETNETIPTYTKEDIISTPTTMTCIVMDVSIKKAEEIFVNKKGEIKTDKPNEDFICIQASNNDYDFNKEYHIKKYKSNSVPENSNLGKFIKRYGLLQENMEITVIKNIDGYYDLVL